jgi:hypothetical protein
LAKEVVEDGIISSEQAKGGSIVKRQSYANPALNETKASADALEFAERVKPRKSEDWKHDCCAPVEICQVFSISLCTIFQFLNLESFILDR